MAAPMTCIRDYVLPHKTSTWIYSLITCLVFSTLIYVGRVSSSELNNDEWEAHLLCRRCGHEITMATDLIRQTSNLALNQRNDTILGVDGVLIQLFENPQGRVFELITTRLAHVKKENQASSQHSWFPPNLWRIVTCPHCRSHLGWSFEPPGHKLGIEDSDDTFYGLILNHLIHQEYADSLVMMPKMYCR